MAFSTLLGESDDSIFVIYQKSRNWRYYDTFLTFGVFMQSVESHSKSSREMDVICTQY